MDNFPRFVVLAALALGAVWVAEPFVMRFVFTTDEPRPISARGDLADYEKGTVEVFRKAAPSVVQVAAETRSPDAEGGDGAATGTGFVWDRAGHIVTNNHVVANAVSVAVRFASGQVVPARIVGQAPNYDLAVLQVPSTAPLPPPLPLGTSRDLAVGQSAFAIGNPFGLDQSLTSGIISALQRHLPTAGGREIAGVIQTDAAINPGNSGGPLLDSAARVIGVNTAIFSPSGANAGIGFAIPVDVVNRVVPSLIRDGRVPVPGIGIVTTSDAGSLEQDGVVIARVVPGSPAERAGLRGLGPGGRGSPDVITEVNGARVSKLGDLVNELEKVGIGNKARLTVARGASRIGVEVPVIDIGQPP